MLTPSAVTNAKPQAKLYKLADERGMYLLVRPDGGRWWRFDYRRPGTPKRNTLSLGTFPDVSLRKARERREEARKLLADGIDPGNQRKAEAAKGAATFGAVAGEWLDKQRGNLAAVTCAKVEWQLSLAEPLQDRPIADLAAPEVLDVLRKIEAHGTIETAHRVKQRIGTVLRYAIATGRASHDCTAELRGALTPVASTARAAITDPAKVADLLRAIDSYTGQPVTHAALRLAPLLFVRPGNLRAMEWTELDLDGAEWRIPAGKMKMHDEHVVPLPAQAIAILRDLQPLTGRGRYCFPSLRTADRPMSENTVNAALRRMGYDKATMTGHGFRALASTRLNEMGWAPDVIERQLAHIERNKVRAVYNRAQYMDERRKMMQAWADYLDGLRAGANVVAFKRKAN
ncbi:MAG TPA: integrase arm-type DNA-binding domain-containing protein [Rhodanobacteraceae bacterium]